METNPPSQGKSFTRYLPTIARILMGLAFFAGGLSGLLMKHDLPPEMPEGAKAFVVAMTNTGYMMPMVSGTQLIVGALLLANCFVPLTLALLAPLLVNIVAFHAFLAPDGIIIGIVLCALEIYLAWAYRRAFLPMLAMRVRPES